MITNARTSKKSWPRRVLSAALTLTLAIAVLAGFVLAGAMVTSRHLHQSAPTASTGTSPVSVRYAEPGHSAAPQPRGTAAGSWSRLSRARTAPSPATSSRRTTSSRARPRSPPTSRPTSRPRYPSRAGRRSFRRTRSPTSTQTLPCGLTWWSCRDFPSRRAPRRHPCAAGSPASTTTGRGSWACAPGQWSWPPPGCSTGWTPPATGRASAPSKPAVPPCTGSADASMSRTGP